MNYDIFSKELANYLITYNNVNKLSLMQLFRGYISNSKNKDIDEDKVLVKVISYISEYGYDIVNTHPLKLEKYKWLNFNNIS